MEYLQVTNRMGQRVHLITFIVPSLSTEGVMWFSDLTTPDPLYILPVLLMVSNLVNIEVSSSPTHLINQLHS